MPTRPDWLMVGASRQFVALMDNLFAPPGLVGRTLGRADLAPLCAGPTQVVIDCYLEEADLSGLDLTRWRFERCNLRRSDFAGSRLEGTFWQSCRAPFAQFSGANPKRGRVPRRRLQQLFDAPGNPDLGAICRLEAYRR